MRKQQFNVIQRMSALSSISADDLAHVNEGLVLSGYTVERHAFTVHYENGTLVRRITPYRGLTDELAKVEWLAEDLVPNKRVYPEDTDYEFTKLLLSRGVDVPFTTWSDQRADRLEYEGETR